MIHILDSIKLRFRKERQLYADLFSILGFYPHNISLYKQALAHSSVREKGDNGKTINNERLEFLGDAIIEAVVSDVVFHRYQKKREGFLTTTRSKVVQRETLNKLAVDLNLDKMIHTAMCSEEQRHSSMAGNAFEALIGAIYLDRGYAACQWFIRNRIFNRHINLDALAHKETNFKSKIIEWSQKYHVKLEFTIPTIEKEGTDCPVFYAEVYIEGLKISEAKGLSKKESHQQAAKEALQRLRCEPQLVRELLKRKKQTKKVKQETAEVNAENKATATVDDTKGGKNESETPHKPRRRKSRGAVRQPEAEIVSTSDEQTKEEAIRKENIIRTAEEAAFTQERIG